MRLRLVVLVLALCLFLPKLTLADELYTLSVDYSGINGFPVGTSVQWQFEVPSILTSTTTITDLLSFSLGSALSGCGGIASVEVDNPSSTKPDALAFFGNLCGSNGVTGGAISFFGAAINAAGVYTAYTKNGIANGTLTISAVPEPSAIFLLGSGLLTLVGFAFLKKRYYRGRSALRSTALPARV
jgi:hypothetical protein